MAELYIRGKDGRPHLVGETADPQLPGRVTALEERVESIVNYSGATASKPGVAGLVPSASAGTDNRFLSAFGDWRHGTTREVLVEPKTLYVRTDGDDGNDGSVDDSAHAFRTIAAAVNFAHRHYFVEQNVYPIIQLGAGTFSGIDINAPYGAMNSLITLSGAGKGQTFIESTDSYCLKVHYGEVFIKELCIQHVTNDVSTAGVTVAAGSLLRVVNCAFRSKGTNSSTVRMIDLRGEMYAPRDGENSIINERAGAAIFCDLQLGGRLNGGGSWDVSGKFSPFINADLMSCVNFSGTFSGNATGKRYVCSRNSLINTNGKGPDYLPGDEGGTVDKTSHYF